MTGAIWRSAFVAALFALHPLRVESVAWMAERKDVLSGFFFMLTLGRMPATWRSPKSRVQSPKFVYWSAFIFFALGLMSKPMLVTLPFVLLLLDYWPLARVRMADGGWRSQKTTIPQLPGATKRSEGGSTFNQLLFEKLPFFALAAASSIVTFWTQHKGGSVVSTEDMSLPERAFHPLAGYTIYLGKIFWPENLAIFYPFTPMYNVWELICYILPPVLLSVFCLRRACFQSWLFVGWFWFVVMLVPVIGFVQVGLQSVADRYTYLPAIGLFIIVAWGMAGIAAISAFWRTFMTLGAAGLLLACLLGTRNQLGYWQNNIKLFSRTIEVTRENNFEGYLLVGDAFLEANNLNGAARSYESALKINPNFEESRLQLAEVRLRQTNYEAVLTQANEVLRLNPKNAEAYKFSRGTPWPPRTKLPKPHLNTQPRCN